MQKPQSAEGEQARRLAGADGARLNHRMKRYTLPRGNGMSFAYYANGRVFSLPQDHRGLRSQGQTTQRASFRYRFSISSCEVTLPSSAACSERSSFWRT